MKKNFWLYKKILERIGIKEYKDFHYLINFFIVVIRL